MTTEYPLKVREMREFEGGYDPIALYSKGHHETASFLAAIHGDTGCDLEFDANDVKQTWYRCVPSGPGTKSVGMMYLECKGGRGAFPATVVEINA